MQHILIGWGPTQPAQTLRLGSYAQAQKLLGRAEMVSEPWPLMAALAALFMAAPRSRATVVVHAAREPGVVVLHEALDQIQSDRAPAADTLTVLSGIREGASSLLTRIAELTWPGTSFSDPQPQPMVLLQAPDEPLGALPSTVLLTTGQQHMWVPGRPREEVYDTVVFGAAALSASKRLRFLRPSSPPVKPEWLSAVQWLDVSAAGNGRRPSRRAADPLQALGVRLQGLTSASAFGRRTVEGLKRELTAELNRAAADHVIDRFELTVSDAAVDIVVVHGPKVRSFKLVLSPR